MLAVYQWEKTVGTKWCSFLCNKKHIESKPWFSVIAIAQYLEEAYFQKHPAYRNWHFQKAAPAQLLLQWQWPCGRCLWDILLCIHKVHRLLQDRRATLELSNSRHPCLQELHTSLWTLCSSPQKQHSNLVKVMGKYALISSKSRSSIDYCYIYPRHGRWDRTM